MKPIVIVLTLGLLSSTSSVMAGLSSLPSWARGDMNCKIDGRPARMNWQVVDDPQTSCDGDICSSTSGVKTVGRFSDNGGPWVELGLGAVSNGSNTMNIRYLGAEPANWQLTYNASTEVATGWTTWRGTRYPLSCWKGEVSLPDRCRAYANEAVRQFQSAQRRLCNIPQDARWQANQAAHYGWCMQVRGRVDLINAETNARNATLRQCRLMSAPIQPGIIPRITIPR